MNKTTVYAASIAGALGASITGVFAQECGTSSQPDHQYIYERVPLGKVLSVQKRTVFGGGDASSVTQFQNGRTVETIGKTPTCLESASYILYAKRQDFLKMKRESSDGRIYASIIADFKSTGSDVRGCLSIPVKKNSVEMDGNTVKISFTPDENPQMRGQRTRYVGIFFKNANGVADSNLDVLCYKFDPGKVSEVVRKAPPKQPVTNNVQTPSVAPAAQQQPSSIFDFFKPAPGR